MLPETAVCHKAGMLEFCLVLVPEDKKGGKRWPNYVISCSLAVDGTFSLGTLKRLSTSFNSGGEA